MQMDSELQYFNTGTTHLHQSIHAGDVWLRVFDRDVAKMKVGQLACHEVHLWPKMMKSLLHHNIV